MRLKKKMSACLFMGLALAVITILTIIFWPVPRTMLHSQNIASQRIFDRHGQLLREVLSNDQGRGHWLPLKYVPISVCQATIAAEDKRFYQHWGVDLLALARAASLNLRHSRIISGGSTITQQLARRLYQLPRANYTKPLEMLLALRLEIWLSKEGILEQYLNRIPYGNQTFGIEAAALLYFDKPAVNLSLSEAAFLAGLPQSPTRLNPFTNLDAAVQRQRHVLNLMLRNGLISEEDYVNAQVPVRISEKRSLFRAPHFTQMLLTQLAVRDSARILTTLDLTLQKKIETLLIGHVENLHQHNVTNAAAVVLDNNTGAIRAWVGSRNFFDQTIQGQVDGVLALRQPGSTLKPFLYILALENGFTAASLLPDIESAAFDPEQDLRVRNYDEKYHGPVRLRTALACSYNIPAVRMTRNLGVSLLLTRLLTAGLTSLTKPASHYGPGLTLGNGEVSLLHLTNAYRAFARGGEWSPAHFLRDMEGIGVSTARSITTPQIAFLISDILSDPIARTPAFGNAGPLRLPFQCAAKTGTSKDFRDNWTVGFSSEYTVGVWVGNFDGLPMRQISGVTGAAPLFHDIMLVLHDKYDPAPFTVPNGMVRKHICAASGQLPNRHCPQLLQEWFLAGSEPKSECRVHQTIVLDRRNGLLATPHTPVEHQQSTLFTVWPSEYHHWMSEQKLPLPPVATSSEDSLVFKVLFPHQGDIFKLDPVLRRDFQRLTLRAQVPLGTPWVEWFVNEQMLGRAVSPFQMEWTLQKGEHRIFFKSKHEGLDYACPEIKILVLP